MSKMGQDGVTIREETMNHAIDGLNALGRGTAYCYNNRNSAWVGTSDDGLYFYFFSFVHTTLDGKKRSQAVR